MLLPDRLAGLWRNVEASHLSREDFVQEQERLLGLYRLEWERALLCNGETDLRTSLLHEVACYYGISDITKTEYRCDLAVDTLKREWKTKVDLGEHFSIELFYESPTHIYDLINWHSLKDDNDPLAYVLALNIARSVNVQRCLDFGSGVGSGALLFCFNDIHMTLADISTNLLDFARWRITQRGLVARFLDLKKSSLADAKFDMILAMDVFEHLENPVEAVSSLWRAMRHGGLLFARIHAEMDSNHPQCSISV